MLRLLHDENLIDDELLAGLVRQVHLLDSDLLACREGLGDVYMSRSTEQIYLSAMGKLQRRRELSPLTDFLDGRVERLRVILTDDLSQLLHDLRFAERRYPPLSVSHGRLGLGF